jgi:hypothetical protein
MRIRIAVPEEHVSPDVIDAALEAVTRLDEHMIRAGQTPTSHELVKAGARWRPEDPGDEHFDHGGTIAKRGWGDCDDWAPLHAATLRATGEDPGARARVAPSGPSTYHAFVERSDGSHDDPSVAAGMKPTKTSGVNGAGDGDNIEIWACDPHDGRIYQGQLAPTVGPISVRCGPGLALRAASVVGVGTLWQARADVPIAGSPLVHVHSYWRRGHRGRRVHGASPYALSCTAHGCSPFQALNDAIVGAVMCGEAAGLPTSLDRYKLLAVQAALTGASPGQVREGLIAQIHNDVQAHAEATGTHPSEHTANLLAELDGQGVQVGIVVGDLFSDIGHIASGVVSAVSDVANTVAHAVSSVPWGDIIHDVQAAVSVVPVLGTAVSDVIATAESAYDAAAAALSGNPLEGAIHAAYNYALGSIPGAAALHPVLDPIVDTLLHLTIDKEPVDSAILNGILQDVPDSPSFGGLSPRSVAASLAHMIVGHLGVKNTGAPVPKPAPQTQLAMAPPGMGAFVHAQLLKQQAAARAAHPAARKPPPPIHAAMHAVRKKPLGVPHAAVHVSTAPRTPIAHPAAARPGSPGAPPGATHWACAPGPGGTWLCRWQ